MARERGQVLPLVAALMVMCGLAAMALGRLGGRVAMRARAQAAADAAALSGVVDGRTGAERLAALNSGRLVGFAPAGGDVRVEVDVGGVVAAARARAGPVGGDAAPAMRAALARAEQVLGAPVHVDTIVAPGLAVDVDVASVVRLAAVGDQTGLCRFDPIRWPRRFGVCPPPPSALTGLDGG